MAIPIEMGHENRDENKNEEGVEEAETEGVKIGDIIDSGGRNMKVTGYTAPEGNPGRAFVTEKLSDEELEKYQQRENIVAGKIKNQIEANPDAIVDVEQARKYWGRLYDEAGNGNRMDMQINEIYAQRYEEGVRQMKDRILVEEQRLKFVKNEAEKQAILSNIEQLRKDIASNEKESHDRRGYNNPGK